MLFFGIKNILTMVEKFSTCHLFPIYLHFIFIYFSYVFLNIFVLHNSWPQYFFKLWSNDRLIRGIQSHNPLAWTTFKISSLLAKIDIGRKLNLRSWKWHTPILQVNNTRLTQVGYSSSHLTLFRVVKERTMEEQSSFLGVIIWSKRKSRLRAISRTLG